MAIEAPTNVRIALEAWARSMAGNERSPSPLYQAMKYGRVQAKPREDNRSGLADRVDRAIVMMAVCGYWDEAAALRAQAGVPGTAAAVAATLGVSTTELRTRTSTAKAWLSGYLAALG